MHNSLSFTNKWYIVHDQMVNDFTVIQYVKDQFKYQVTKYHLSGHLVFVTRREANPAELKSANGF